MTIKHTLKSYELELTLPVAIEGERELEYIKDSIQELRKVFANHPRKPLSEGLIMLGNPSRYARVLRTVEEVLENAKPKSYEETN